MSTIEEIQSAIDKLPLRERGRLRHWFLAKDSRAWDDKIKLDAVSGKLDKLAAEALDEHSKGQSRAL